MSTNPSLFTSAIVIPDDQDPLSTIPEPSVLSINLKFPVFLYILSPTKFPPKKRSCKPSLSKSAIPTPAPP